MTWGTVAVAGASLVGGMIASNAASDAASQQANAANQATQAQKDMFNTTVGLEAPYRTAGVDATNKLSYFLGINPDGYSASQMIAPGVSAPAATQYATGTGAAGPGSGPPGVAVTAPASAAIPPELKNVILNGLGSTSLPQDVQDSIRSGLSSGAVSPELASTLQAQIPSLAMSPVMQSAFRTAAASASQAPTPSSTTGGQIRVPEPSAGGPGVAAGAAGPTDPAYGSLLHNFGLSDFQMDPGIQFQTQQGNLALQNSQAAKDGVMSGSALKDLIAYNQGMAGTGYQSAFDRYMANKQFTLGSLMGVSQLGQAAAGNTVNNAGGFSSGIASTIQGAGNAQAAGTVGSANALSGAASGASNAYLLSNMLKTSGSSGGNTMTVDPTMSYIYGTGGIGD